jgi:thiol-disulfide isomerase/thioredoxin
MLAGIVNLNDGVLGGADEDFYNRLCQDKNLTADQAGELFWINVIRLRRLIESPKDNNEPDKKAIEAQFDKIEKQINDFGQKFKSQGIMLQGIFQTANGIENLYPQRSLKILELAAKYASGDDKKRLDGLIRNIGILGTAPQIKFKAIDSNEVDLSKLKGKVVLVDFWATWCPPCLEELPNVLETYKKYHDKGFEIIGISFDKDIDTVKKFVKEKGMVWPQYADGKFWDNDLGVYFGIQQIPTTWLVDKSGKVVDKDMRGSELAAKVAKLLGIDK